MLIKKTVNEDRLGRVKLHFLGGGLLDIRERNRSIKL